MVITLMRSYRLPSPPAPRDFGGRPALPEEGNPCPIQVKVEPPPTPDLARPAPPPQTQPRSRLDFLAEVSAQELRNEQEQQQRVRQGQVIM